MSRPLFFSLLFLFPAKYTTVPLASKTPTRFSEFPGVISASPPPPLPPKPEIQEPVSKGRTRKGNDIYRQPIRRQGEVFNFDQRRQGRKGQQTVGNTNRNFRPIIGEACRHRANPPTRRPVYQPVQHEVGAQFRRHPRVRLRPATYSLGSRDPPSELPPPRLLPPSSPDRRSQ